MSTLRFVNSFSKTGCTCTHVHHCALFCANLRTDTVVVVGAWSIGWFMMREIFRVWSHNYHQQFYVIVYTYM
jgi:hypothetical protein